MGAPGQQVEAGAAAERRAVDGLKQRFMDMSQPDDDGVYRNGALRMAVAAGEFGLPINPSTLVTNRTELTRWAADRRIV